MPRPQKHQDTAARQRAYRQRIKLVRTKAPTLNGLPAPPTLSSMPSSARWKELRRIAEAALQTLFDEMESYRDERSDAWLEGDKGEAFQEVLDKVEEILDAIKDID